MTAPSASQYLEPAGLPSSWRRPRSSHSATDVPAVVLVCLRAAFVPVLLALFEVV